MLSGLRHVSRRNLLSLRPSGRVLSLSTVQHGHTEDLGQSPSLVQPTLDYVKNLPCGYSEMDNDSIVLLASNGDQGACEERLVRVIMATDSIEWEEATEVVEEMRTYNREGMDKFVIPQWGFIGSCFLVGVITFPLCFHEPSATYFNEIMVTADVPPPEDRETWLEIGIWTWNWMEPPLGHASFFILCYDFARAQLDNLKYPRWHTRIIDGRAAKIANRYPQYPRPIVEAWSASHGFSP